MCPATNRCDCTREDPCGPGCYQANLSVPQADGDQRMYLPEDSDVRKEMPITTGVLDYFPLAFAALARLSKKGNDKHNPGQPLHWARGKSMDHADCIARHLIDRGNIDPGTGESHSVPLAWRALALLQEEEEQRLGVRMSRGSKVDP